MRIDLDEFEAHFNYFRKINQENLENIHWYHKGVEKKIASELIDDFNFIGLSNKDFPKYLGWIK